MEFQTKPGHLSAGEALRLARMTNERTAHLRGCAQSAKSKQSAIATIGNIKLDWVKK